MRNRVALEGYSSQERWPNRSYATHLQEWKICKNNLSEENPCGICLLGSSGKTVFHKCANGINHVYHKACMKDWYDIRTSTRRCPTCNEKVSIGDLKGRYQDLAEKFEQWNYPQADQVENLSKKGFTIALVAGGVTAVVVAGGVTAVAATTALGGATIAMATLLGCRPRLEQGWGMIATVATAATATVAVDAGVKVVAETGLLRARDEGVVDLAVAVGIGTAIEIGAVAVSRGMGVATDSLTCRIVKWMKA